MPWLDELQRVAVTADTLFKARQQRVLADATDDLGRLSMPTLILHSVDDRMNDFEFSRTLASHIPDARLVPLESSNHILLENDEAWSEFAKGARDFLDKGVRPAGSPAVVTEPLDDMRRCTTKDGTEIAYAISGEGFPVVKAPNWITNLETDRTNPSYRHWINELERSNRFIRSDMRGFGLSELEPSVFTFDAMGGGVGRRFASHDRRSSESAEQQCERVFHEGECICDCR
jgi:hypothetical protein